MVIGEAEQMRGAFAGLDVFKGNVVDAFAAAKGMAEVAQHLHATRPDIDLLGADVECLHEGMRILQRDIARGETGHRVAEDGLARQAEAVHRLRRHDERMRRIKPAGNTDHDMLNTCAEHSLHQRMHLNIVGLVAPLVARGRIARDIGETLHLRVAAECPLLALGTRTESRRIACTLSR